MPITVPNLDDRTAEQIYSEALARIPVHTPEWTNFNDSDPGVTLLQLFAFMTENLLYRSNRIPEANRRKFLTLLGVPLQPASPGRGLVVFRNERGPVQPWPLEAGIELRAGKTPFRTRTSVCVLPVEASVFVKKPQTDLDAATLAQYQLYYDSFLQQDADQLQFYKSVPIDLPETGKPLPSVDLTDAVNGAIDRSLWVALVGPKNVPLTTVRAALAGQTLTLGIYPSPQCEEGLSLEPQAFATPATNDPGLVFEIAAPEPDPTDATVGSGPARYTRLDVEYAESVLERPGIVRVVLPVYEKLLTWDFDPQEEGTGDYPPLVEDKAVAARIATWVRIRLPEESDSAADKPQRKARIAWAGVNAARIIQAVPVIHERLGVANGAPDQFVKVTNTPVIVDDDPETATVEEFVLEIQDADGRWQRWESTDDLYAAGSQDEVYTIDPESGVVQFGDGLRGKRPPAGRLIRASYEYGGGPAGKVAIDAVNKCPVLPGGFKVGNPLATWGGKAGETTADGERNIPRYLKHRDRLVTASDFRDIVLRTPEVEVGRVEVLPLFQPEGIQPATSAPWPGAVTVMVIPRNDPVQPDAPVPDRLFLDAVCRWLDPRRLVTTEIFVRGPVYVPVWVSVGIVTQAGQMREQVQRAVRDALRAYLSPLTGGPAGASAAELDPVCVTTDPADPCAVPSGAGWPLEMEVRRQDLEAVVTRVPGVRYVQSIRLGVTSGGATLTDTERVAMTGLMLPRLAGLSVREGDAEDLGALMGQQPATDVPPNLVAVPVLPKKC